MEKAIARRRRPLITLLSLALAFFLTAMQPLYADDAGEIRLDADKISFEESTGIATAEGNVRIQNDEVRLFAPFVEYDSFNQQVRARASGENAVSLLTAEGRLDAEHLDYNLQTREGMLQHPNGKVDAFFVKGETLSVKPTAQAENAKQEKAGQESPEDLSARWTRASVTTCDEPHPHYRFEAKSVTVVPDKSLVISKPRVYLGKHLLFSYPFDYFISLDKRSSRHKQVVFPKFGYESSKGAGLGVGGAYGWVTGAIDFEVIGWTDDIWETDTLLMQDITENLTAFARTRRIYDKEREETKWRPSWGFDYERNGWRMHTIWSQREHLSVEKRAGTDSKYILWRKPEVNVVSPWFDDKGIGGQFRLFGTWGKYEDATTRFGATTDRWGLGMQIQGDFRTTSDKLQPFYNAIYWHYDYDSSLTDSATQQILDAVVGVRWEAGDFDMETAYLRRWAWGNSPMLWDDYNPREEIYQEIGYRIHTGQRDISWKLGLRGAYDIRNEELAEMVYKVAYDQHCLLWEAVYRDDRRGDDDWMGVTLTIKAYPNAGARLSGNDLFDPATGPDSLIPSTSVK